MAKAEAVRSHSVTKPSPESDFFTQKKPPRTQAEDGYTHCGTVLKSSSGSAWPQSLKHLLFRLDSIENPTARNVPETMAGGVGVFDWIADDIRANGRRSRRQRVSIVESEC